MNRFEPAMESVILKSYEEGRCDIQTKINMMIGKLCDLYYRLGQDEISAIEFGKDISEKDKLEEQIEQLEDDISKELFKLKEI